MADIIQYSLDDWLDELSTVRTQDHARYVLAQTAAYLAARNIIKPLLGPGLEVDALDRHQTWRRATVQRLRTSPRGERWVSIHYAGWGSELDEEIRVEGERLAPAGLHTHGFWTGPGTRAVIGLPALREAAVARQADLPQPTHPRAFAAAGALRSSMDSKSTRAARTRRLLACIQALANLRLEASRHRDFEDYAWRILCWIPTLRDLDDALDPLLQASPTGATAVDEQKNGEGGVINGDEKNVQDQDESDFEFEFPDDIGSVQAADPTSTEDAKTNDASVPTDSKQQPDGKLRIVTTVTTTNRLPAHVWARVCSFSGAFDLCVLSCVCTALRDEIKMFTWRERLRDAYPFHFRAMPPRDRKKSEYKKHVMSVVLKTQRMPMWPSAAKPIGSSKREHCVVS